MKKLIMITTILLVIAFTVSYNLGFSVLPKLLSSDETSPTEPQVSEKAAEPSNEQEETQSAEITEDKELSEESQVEVKPIDPTQGELIAEGLVTSVDSSKQVILFEQEFDDNSVKIDPEIKLTTNTKIFAKGEAISLNQIKAGDYITIILNGDGTTKVVDVYIP